MCITVPKQHRRGRRVAYVVFEGLAPGIYSTWQVPSAVTGLHAYLTGVVASGRKLNLSSQVSQVTSTKVLIVAGRPNLHISSRSLSAPFVSCLRVMVLFSGHQRQLYPHLQLSWLHLPKHLTTSWGRNGMSFSRGRGRECIPLGE